MMGMRCAFPSFFYFTVERNNDQSHAMTVQPNSQLAQRIRVVFVLSCSVLPARYDGIMMTKASSKIAIIYFTITIF